MKSRSYKPSIKMHGLCLLMVVMFVACTARSITQGNPEPTMAPTQTPLPSLIPTKFSSTATLSSPTVTLTVAKTLTLTPTPTLLEVQSNDSILSCKNWENPTPLIRMKDLHGVVFYNTNSSNQLFALRGEPPATQGVQLFSLAIDSYSFSKDGQWLIAYTARPKQTVNDRYPIFLVSKEGKVYPKTIDVSSFTAKIKPLADFFFRGWSFDWINTNMVSINIAYGEAKDSLHIYGFLNILDGTWWSNPIEVITNRSKYEFWTNVSPDLTHIFYSDQEDKLALWDVEKQKTIWTNDQSFVDGQNSPIVKWSSDGHMAAVYSPFPSISPNILILLQNGTTYTTVQPPSFSEIGRAVSFADFQWSKDNRFLVINGGILDKSEPSSYSPMLYRYDTDQRKYVYQCPLDLPSNTSVYSSVIISPDGNLVTPRNRLNITKHLPFRIYNMKDFYVYQVPYGAYGAVGWVEDFSLNWK